MRDPLKCPKCGNDQAACICPKGGAGGGSSDSGNRESSEKNETVLQSVLVNASIPALSAAWVQHDETRTLIGGVADPFREKHADEETLFQAASLGKPVSAAIILDLASQGKWDLDKPLAAMCAEMNISFGSKEMQEDKRYEKLTTRMILSQCSGLPNWNPPRFEAEPGDHFTYSGLAYDCLKEVVEAKLKTTWGELAQAFFDKVGMRHSIFQLPETTHLKDSTIALGHLGDGTALPPPSPEGFREIPAASMLTTPSDYVRFLQYCYSQPPSDDPSIPSLRELFVSPKPTRLDPAEHEKYSAEAPEKITWGAGMGLFQDGEREVAFHWGNNPHSKAFCAIDLHTGDSVACFSNSQNGPNVFPAVTESVVGDMKPVFEWLSNYDHFNPVVKVESAETLRTQVDNLMAPVPKPEAQRTREEERDAVSVDMLCRGAGLMSSSHASQSNVAPDFQPQADQSGMKK